MSGLQPEDLEPKKMWLKHSADPWTKVLLLWEETYVDRQKEIRASASAAMEKTAVTGIAHVFKEWPRYKDPNGYTLVSMFC